MKFQQTPKIRVLVFLEDEKTYDGAHISYICIARADQQQRQRIYHNVESASSYYEEVNSGHIFNLIER